MENSENKNWTNEPNLGSGVMEVKKDQAVVVSGNAVTIVDGMGLGSCETGVGGELTLGLGEGVGLVVVEDVISGAGPPLGANC